MPTDATPQWWLFDGQGPHGPYSHTQVVEQLKTGALSWNLLACRGDSRNWLPLATWPEFHAQTPPEPPQPGRVQTTVARPPASSQQPAWHIWIPLGVVGAALVGFVMICVLGILIHPSEDNAQADWLAKVRAADAVWLQQHKQEVFNSIHPVGTAKNIELHNVSLHTGKAGQPVLSYRFTVRWEGPVLKDGYTNVHAILDVESQRLVQVDVLATNGTTNAEAQQMLVDFGILMGEMVRQEQQRRQHEQLIRRYRSN